MSIYAYHRVFGPRADKIAFHAEPENYVSKFFGFSWFLRELAPVLKAWVAATGDLVWYRQHSSGGHFAAMERPDALLEDVEDSVGKVWKK